MSDTPHQLPREASNSDPIIGFVAIGRNEGDRLVQCLTSLLAVAEPSQIIYVDSGSQDASVAEARTRNVGVVDLNDGHAFTAARARNKGFDALTASIPEITHVMFIDGDCAIDPAFTAKAIEAFVKNPAASTKPVGIVTGFCRERFPDQTIYNRMCDLEWRGPVGEIDACGGIFMIDRTAFEAAGGFNPTVIAAEDDELCIRVRAKGYSIHRIDQDMCQHDAAMTRFSQWWKRAERAGHAYGLVGDLHPGYFKASRRRAVLWAAIIPLAILIGLPIFGLPIFGLWALALTGLYPLSFMRTRAGLIGVGTPPSHATLHARYLVLAKFPNLLGMLKYWWKKTRGKAVDIIEYK